MIEYHQDTCRLLKTVLMPQPEAPRAAESAALAAGFELPQAVGEWISLDPKGHILRLYSTEDWPHLSPQADSVFALEDERKFLRFYTENQGSFELAYEIGSKADPAVYVVAHQRSGVFPTGLTFSEFVFSRVFEWQCYTPSETDPLAVDPFDDEFESEYDFGQPIYLKLPVGEVVKKLTGSRLELKSHSRFTEPSDRRVTERWLYSGKDGSRVILMGGEERCSLAIFYDATSQLADSIIELFEGQREGYAVGGIHNFLPEIERRLEGADEFYARLIAGKLITPLALSRLKGAIDRGNPGDAFPNALVIHSNPVQRLDYYSEELKLKLALVRINPHWWEIDALQCFEELE